MTLAKHRRQAERPMEKESPSSRGVTASQSQVCGRVTSLARLRGGAMYRCKSQRREVWPRCGGRLSRRQYVIRHRKRTASAFEDRIRGKGHILLRACKRV